MLWRTIALLLITAFAAAWNHACGLTQNTTDLPELVVESRNHRILHILAYIREYSTLASQTDTVFLFREKTVDYMLPVDRDSKFKGWTTPRVLNARSYYRFTDSSGLDSVSDNCNHHFSWSDWVGIMPSIRLPAKLQNTESAIDTIHGKYQPAEIWQKENDRIQIQIDLLADTTNSKWSTGFSNIFNNTLDFDIIKIKLNYDNVCADSVSASDLTEYSFNIESTGRGRRMFRFNSDGEPFTVSTHAEVYVLDKEYITQKEAKKWDGLRFDKNEISIFESPNAPEFSAATLKLISRVDEIDADRIRLLSEPDRKMISSRFGLHNRNFQIGHRALSLLKQLTGITLYKSHKNFKHNWDKFRRGRIDRNQDSY